jgi:DNA-binding IclR family transcriptional regulator
VKLPAQPNQSLVDGLAVLQALASAGQPVGSRAMARQLGIEPTRANRLLKTLAALGVVRQAEDRRYEPGPGMHVLAAQAMFGSGLVQRAMGPMASLRQPRLAVALGVLWRMEVAYLIHAAPNQAIATGIGRVGLFPAERSAIGVALLARRPEREVRALLEAAGREVDASGLNRRLRHARRHGYAAVEQDDDVLSLAVVLPGQSDAAIAVSGQGVIHEIVDQVDRLKSVARQITSVDEPATT